MNDISLSMDILQILPSECDIRNPTEILSSFESKITGFKNNVQMLHGVRVEKMFGYLASTLGQCSFIRQEDTKIPDYRLILKDGTRFFTEVKNCHSNKGLNSKIALKKDYIAKY